MDTRSGALYPSLEAGLAAGVPAENLVEVRPVDKEPDIVVQTSGPFKGRIYERLPGGGLKRRLDLEAKQARERKLKALEELQRQVVRRGGRPRRQVEEMSAEEFHAELEAQKAIVDEVTRNPRADGE